VVFDAVKMSKVTEFVNNPTWEAFDDFGTKTILTLPNTMELLRSEKIK
jgi:hypothetical protein